MTGMKVDDPLVILIRIKNSLISAASGLSIASQMSADRLETAGLPTAANFLRHSITQTAKAIATANGEFAELLKRENEPAGESIGLDDRMADPKPGPEWDL